MTHSEKCINFNENSCYEFCFCDNCSCHSCSWQKSATYRKNYIENYYKKHEAII